jgi:hypothetical protein
MANDGFGTLSARLMERGTERVRAVLDESSPDESTVAVDMTYTPVRSSTADAPQWLATSVPPAKSGGTFGKKPASNSGASLADMVHRPREAANYDHLLDDEPADTSGNGAATVVPHHNDRSDAEPDAEPRPRRAPKIELRRPPVSTPAPALDEDSAHDASQNYAPAADVPETEHAASAAVSPTPFVPFAERPSAPIAEAPVAEAAGNALAEERPAVTPGQNPVDAQANELSERRASAGASLTIKQPPSGDMSQVTVTMSGGPPRSDTPVKGGQKPSSITYERRSLEELAREAEALANGESSTPVWIETPTYSGPDRRHMDVSPEIERRGSVPPRIKIGVRLEQERYLRLKLAATNTGRTQQDLVTSAVDAYLDTIDVDRFVRIAMGFGVASDGTELEEAS